MTVKGPQGRGTVGRGRPADGVSAAYIWQLRKGVRDNPTERHLEALADFLGVPPPCFFDEDDARQIEGFAPRAARRTPGSRCPAGAAGARSGSHSVQNVARSWAVVGALSGGSRGGRVKAALNGLLVYAVLGCSDFIHGETCCVTRDVHHGDGARGRGAVP